MDAISFVLGVRSSSLRSSALKDLVYRSGKTSGKGKGKAANQEGDGESESDEGEQDVEEDDEEDGERKAYVIAVYVDEDDEWKFQRRCVVLATTDRSAVLTPLRSISTAGTSEYRLNNKSVTYKVYNDQLEKFNILVKAKNFLVFQVSPPSPAQNHLLIVVMYRETSKLSPRNRRKTSPNSSTKFPVHSITRRSTTRLPPPSTEPPKLPSINTIVERASTERSSNSRK